MPNEPSGMNRKARRAAAKEARAEGEVDTMGFLKLADKFIDVANRENREIKASQVHMAFLYAAARYNAHVAKNVLKVENHEVFVKEMADQYKEMLRQHLGDESLEHSDQDESAEPKSSSPTQPQSPAATAKAHTADDFLADG